MRMLPAGTASKLVTAQSRVAFVVGVVMDALVSLEAVVVVVGRTFHSDWYPFWESMLQLLLHEAAVAARRLTRLPLARGVGEGAADCCDLYPELVGLDLEMLIELEFESCITGRFGKEKSIGYDERMRRRLMWWAVNEPRSNVLVWIEIESLGDSESGGSWLELWPSFRLALQLHPSRPCIRRNCRTWPRSDVSRCHSCRAGLCYRTTPPELYMDVLVMSWDKLLLPICTIKLTHWVRRLLPWECGCCGTFLDSTASATGDFVSLRRNYAKLLEWRIPTTASSLYSWLLLSGEPHPETQSTWLAGRHDFSVAGRRRPNCPGHRTALPGFCCERLQVNGCRVFRFRCSAVRRKTPSLSYSGSVSCWALRGGRCRRGRTLWTPRPADECGAICWPRRNCLHKGASNDHRPTMYT